MKCVRLWFSSVAQSCPTLCNPMDCSTPSFPIRLGQVERHIMLLDLHINLFQFHSGNRFIFSWIQFSSVAQLCPTLQPHGLQHMRLPYPSPTPGACSDSISIESVMPSSHLILFCPLLLLPSIFPSIRVFSSESVLHIRWPKYWSFSFSISLSSVYSGMISFTVDWFDLAVQGTL